jgi:glutamyl-tRNA reductase
MLRELQVLHRAEAVAELPAAIAAAGADGRAFIVHTCQRLVVVCIGRANRDQLLPLLGDWHAEYYEGPHAYAFLLRLACGLESKLTGETEVFGQLKQAWATFAERGSEQAQQLAGYMQSLFRDVKDVRSRFLSNLGSASYGSLVRRLLDQPGERGPVLLVGAGQLAEAVAPWLRGTELWIWSRRHERADALAGALRSRDGARAIRVLDSTVEAELAAWRIARDVVVCVPADAQRDAARAAAWATPRAGRGQLIHLGVDDSADLRDWRAAGKLLNLTAVYALLQAQNELRQAQVRRAERACRERSLLRALGRSDSEPHGWEDLVAIDSLCS